MRKSIISVFTQCESDFILRDSAPLKVAQYCRKQENSLREKKYCQSGGEENENGMPGANRPGQSRTARSDGTFWFTKILRKDAATDGTKTVSRAVPTMTFGGCKLERLKQLRYNSLFCFWFAILVFVKRLFFKSEPKGLKTFLIQLIHSQHFVKFVLFPVDRK